MATRAFTSSTAVTALNVQFYSHHGVILRITQKQKPAQKEQLGPWEKSSRKQALPAAEYVQYNNEDLSALHSQHCRSAAVVVQPAKNVFPTACRCGRTNGSLLVSGGYSSEPLPFSDSLSPCGGGVFGVVGARAGRNGSKRRTPRCGLRAESTARSWPIKYGVIYQVRKGVAFGLLTSCHRRR